MLVFSVSNKNGIQWVGEPEHLGDYFTFGKVWLTVWRNGKAIDGAQIDGSNGSIREGMRDYSAMYRNNSHAIQN